MDSGQALATLAGRRLVVFDLDGTLYDAARFPEYVARAESLPAECLAARLDIPRIEAEERLRMALLAAPGTSLTALLATTFGVSLSAFNRFREARLRPGELLVEDQDLAAAIADLASRFTLVLATNAAPRVAAGTLRALGIAADVFAAVLTAEDLGWAKPDVRFFSAVLERLSCPAGLSVSVGDRLAVDIEPARAVGMAAILVGGPDDVRRLRGARP